MESLLAPSFNLAFLIAVLVYVLKDKVKDFVKTRHSTLKTEIEEVRQNLSSAQVRFEEFQAKLKAIDAELDEIQTQARKDVATESERIIQEAKTTSASIVRDADTASKQLQSEVVDQITRELGLEVLNLVETRVREDLTKDDKKRIRDRFSLDMGSVG